MKLVLILTGGALGTFARYIIAALPHRYVESIFPWGTLTVNALGSFIIGFLWGMFEVRDMSPQARTFIFIGFLGGFTTFSTYALETLNLFREGDIKTGLLNILANNVIAIGLVFSGFFISKNIF